MGRGEEPTGDDGRPDEASSTALQSGEGEETDTASEAEGESSKAAAGGDSGDGAAESSTAALRAKLTGRRVLAGVGVLFVLLILVVALLVPSSLLALVYSPSAEFAAEPVTVADDTVADRGFEETNRETFVVEEDVVLAGQTRTITTSNHRVEYERTVTVQAEEFDAAIFTALSTPAIEVFGTPFNPLADMTHEELLRQFGDELGGEYSDLSGLEEVAEHDGVLAGRETEITQFVLPVEEGGEEVDLYLYVAAVQSGDDLVIAVGGHPASFAQERLTVFEMLAAVEHPVE